MPGPPRPLFADARDVRLEKILVDSACTLPEHRLRGRWDDWFALRVYRARCALPRRHGLGTQFGIDFLRHCRQRNTRARPTAGGSTLLNASLRERGTLPANTSASSKSPNRKPKIRIIVRSEI